MGGSSRLSALAVASVVVTACGLDVVGSAGPSVGDAGPAPDAQPTTSSPRTSVLRIVSEGPAPTSVNLTEEGKRDWAHWSGTRDSVVVNRRREGGNLIGELAVEAGRRSFTVGDTSPVRFTWSDGAPTSAEPETDLFVSFEGDTGTTVTLTLDATKRGVVALYFGTFNARARLDVALSDDSDTPKSTGVYGERGVFAGKFVVEFQGARPDAKVTFRWSMQERLGNLFPVLALAAASLE